MRSLKEILDAVREDVYGSKESRKIKDTNPLTMPILR